MSVVLTETSGADYTPRYLFVSGDHQHGTGKSRHVMKEFLRKRDSVRRQHQLATRTQSRVLPWLRRGDMQQASAQIGHSTADATGSDTSSDFNSRPSSPQYSQCTAESATGDAHTSPAYSTAESWADCGMSTETRASTPCAPKDLVDHLHKGLISRLYETKETSKDNSPASAMTNYIMARPVASRILLAMSSLNRDIAAGRRAPSSGTLALIVEGMRLLQEQFQDDAGVSEDAIVAVINLWAYEVTLSMGFSSEDPKVPKSLATNIQTHLNGLQRLIKVRGGLRNLSSATLWFLAWCVSTMPGYSPIETRMVEAVPTIDLATQPVIDGYYCLTRLFDTLSKIQRQMSTPDSPCSFLDEPAFLPLKKMLLRMSAMRRSLRDQPSPMGRLRKSAALTSSLLFIFDVLLGGTDRAHQDARSRRNELVNAQKRLIEHRLDEEGSVEKIWSVLMTQQERPELELHPRAWPIVEMVNVIKHLDLATIDALSQLLMRYLLPEVPNQDPEAARYDRLLIQIHSELDGLAELG